ncbi:MAG: metalloregulator ArsR/SmtB family transcription factor [Pseudomonadota bacterium]
MSDLFQAIAHPARRQVIEALKAGPLAAGDLSEKLRIVPATLSRHLSILCTAGLIEKERRGVSLIYSLNLSVAEDALAILFDLLRVDQADTRQAPQDHPSKAGLKR